MESLLDAIEQGMASGHDAPAVWVRWPQAEGYWWARTPSGSRTVVRAFGSGELLVNFIGSATDHDEVSLGCSGYRFAKINEPAE